MESAERESRALRRYELAKGIAGFITLLLVTGLLAFNVVQNQRINTLVKEASSRAEEAKIQSEQNQAVLESLQFIFMDLERGQGEARQRLAFALSELDRRLDISDQSTVDSINRLIDAFNRTHPDEEPIPRVSRRNEDTRPHPGPQPSPQPNPQPQPSSRPTPKPKPKPSPTPSPTPTCRVSNPITGVCIVRE